MKRTIITLIAIFAICSVRAQAVISSTTSDFTSVAISGKLKVTLVKSDSSYFSIKLIDAESKNLEWKMNGDQLDIKLKQPLGIGSKKVEGSGEVTIGYSDAFTQIKCSSKAEIYCDGTFTAKQLVIDASSNALVAMEVEVYSLDISGTTSATAAITGSANVISINATANGQVNTVAMECESATVGANSNAEVYVTAVNKLDLKAATNAKIYYKGKPEVLVEKATTFGLIDGF